jgi:hypothetical protein
MAEEMYTSGSAAAAAGSNRLKQFKDVYNKAMIQAIESGQYVATDASKLQGVGKVRAVSSKKLKSQKKAKKNSTTAVLNGNTTNSILSGHYKAGQHSTGPEDMANMRQLIAYHESLTHAVAKKSDGVS